MAGVTNVRGNHTVKAGFEWKKDIWTLASYNNSGRFDFNGAQTALPYLQTTNVSGRQIGMPYASFLLGMANTASINNRRDPQVRKASVGLYVQDSWKVTRKLTLDYGAV